jgi:hypothetical protein
VVSARRLDVGAVRVGSSRTVVLDVANAGTVPLTITRAIAPLGAFSTPTPLPEGISLDAKARVHVRVTFAPTQRGPATGTFRVTSTDGRGPIVVHLVGRGV